MTSLGLERYRAILAVPRARRLVVASLVGRFPIGMLALAIVLLVRRHTGSFADAGAVVAVYGLAAGGVGALQGRLIDRFGQRRILIPDGLLCAAGLVAMVAAVRAGAGTAVLALCAALAGATRPPLTATMRGAWMTLLRRDSRLPTAYAFESVLAEVFFIGGPPAAAGIALATSPALAVLVAAALTVVGTLWFAGSPVSGAWRGEGRAVGRAGALASAGMRTLVVSTVPVGLAFGTLDVAMPAFAAGHGQAAAGGLALGAQALGSMAGGLWYGSRRWSGAIARRYLRLAGVFALGLALPIAAWSLPAMVVLMAIAGLTLAPVVATGTLLLDRLAPAGTATEAYTWVTAATVAGAAAGSALAGAVVQSAGVRWSLVTATGCALVGWLYLLARRRTLGADVAAPRPVYTSRAVGGSPRRVIGARAGYLGRRWRRT